MGGDGTGIRTLMAICSYFGTVNRYSVALHLFVELDAVDAEERRRPGLVPPGRRKRGQDRDPLRLGPRGRERAR